MFVLKSKNIYLSSDIDTEVTKKIYKWHSDLTNIHLFHFFDNKQMTFESFAEKIKRKTGIYLSFFVINDKGNNSPMDILVLTHTIFKWHSKLYDIYS